MQVQTRLSIVEASEWLAPCSEPSLFAFMKSLYGFGVIDRATSRKVLAWLHVVKRLFLTMEIIL